MKDLLGKTINRIFVNENQEKIVFETDQGPIAYEGYGDCCSETWFADFTGVEALLGARIIKVEGLDLSALTDDYGNAKDNRTRQEFDALYGVKFITPQGYADLIYRNSSNGYYGGYSERMERVPDTKGWFEIKEDWQA